MRRLGLALASILLAVGIGLVAQAPAHLGPMWVGKAGGGPPPPGGCGTAPAVAAAAGFTTCIANFDFTASTGSAWLPYSFSGPVSTIANWLDCTNTNSALPWHKGVPGSNFSGAPCGASVVTDPTYGGQVLDMNWLSSYISALPGGVVGIQEAFNGGGSAQIWPDNTVYMELVERQDVVSSSGISSGPNGAYVWGQCEITPVLGEMFGGNNGFIDGVWQNWNGGCSVSTYHAGYTFASFDGSAPWTPPPGGWLGVTHYTKFGMLITSDGVHTTFQCAWVNDQFQTCQSVTPVGGSLGKNYLVSTCGGQTSTGLPVNQHCYTQYIRIWSCAAAPSAHCYGSAQVGTPPAVTYWKVAGGSPALFVATNGSDSNPGTIASPFSTLGKCQTAMRGGASNICYIRAGTYTPAAGAATATGCNNNGAPANIVVLTHAGGDDGETWSYYPGDGIDTATFNGGSIPTAFCLQHVRNVTINGLAFTGFSTALFVDNWAADDGNGVGNTLAGNVIAGGNPGIAADGWIENTSITHNYLRDLTGQGIGASTTQSLTQGGLTGITISGNVILNACTGASDCGPIYVQDYQVPASTNLTISGNFLYQSNAAGAGGRLVYLDDGTSNVAVSNNVALAGGALFACYQIHGGANDVFTGNVCDERAGSDILFYQQTTHTPGSNYPMTGNNFTSNTIVCSSASTCGNGYVGSNSPPAAAVTSSNTYWNFGAVSTVAHAGSGGANGDSSPILSMPSLTCQVGLPASYGPPGFSLPTLSPAPSYC